MLSALEFYSGIGGFHLALNRANLDTSKSTRVVRAFDWDPAAAEVYNHNFGKEIVQRCDISLLTTSDLLPYDADIWLLSPACQPYTVLNPNAKGEADPRAKSFLHLMTNILPALAARKKEPRYILVENVAGFEKSTTRRTVLTILESLRYTVLEFLLTPLQFGIPNSRLRYYLLARKEPFPSMPFPDANGHSGPRRSIPDEGTDWIDPRFHHGSTNVPILPLKEFIDDTCFESSSLYSIPFKILRSKRAALFDIVKPSSTRTCCFTRGYTHMIEGSTILQQAEDLDTTDIFNAYAAAVASPTTTSSHDEENNPLNLLLSLRMRYFTPTELLRLLCFNPPLRLPRASENISSYETYLKSSFPHTSKEFCFPAAISLKTRYRLIGNSVNVYVVSKLISYLLI